MKLKELTIKEFNTFVNSSSLCNYMQSEEYARFMSDYRFDYDYIGLIDENNKVVAASLILYKKIGLNFKYGYAPKGFLVDYYDKEVLSTFLDLIKRRYSKMGLAFIKINPEIVVGEIDSKTYELTLNSNFKLKQELQKNGFIKLKDNIYFESLNPRFNAYVKLKSSSLENYSKTNRNKVNNSLRKGLYLEKGSMDDVEKFYKLLNTDKSITYFKRLFTNFKKNDNFELYFVKIDFEEMIKTSQDLYDKELEKNNLYNEILHRSRRSEDLNRKMQSDTVLCNIKNDIVRATDGLRNHNNKIVAGALVVKDRNRVNIIESGYDKNFAYLNQNYFLYHSLIEYFKDAYDYLDLGGVSGNFKSDSPYRGLNRFKLGFNPKIYEFIGEFDFIINKAGYELLLSSGKLAKEFNKK